jgi:hypothetical protein
MPTATAPAPAPAVPATPAPAPPGPDETGLESSYYTALQQGANQQIGAIYGIDITPVSQASVGGFNYVWEDPSLKFNLATYNYVNSRVAPAAAPAASLNDPISTDYDALLQMITFQYSSTDQEAINAAVGNANAQATSIVSAYTATYGPITDDQLKTSGQPTAIDYVVNYVVAQVWSGTLDAHQPPLSLQEMEGARHLAALLPDMPASGAAMLGTITTYLNILSNVLPLQMQQMNAMWVLQQLVANTEQPTTANGGMTTVAPNGGGTAVHVGYTVNASVAGIQNDLANTGRTLSISMDTSQSSSTTLQASVAGSQSFEVDAGWFLGLQSSSGGSSNLFSFQGTGSSASVDLTFAGYTYVPVQPMQFQSDTVTGWFSTAVLAQALQNYGQDVTGYTFIGTPQWDLGAEGDFGMITGAVIANFPTISVTYAEGDWSQFSQNFQQNSSWSTSFLGIAVANFSQSTYTATAHQNGSSGGFTVTFAPSQQILTVPDLQKQAYVIGATIGYPGTGNL